MRKVLQILKENWFVLTVFCVVGIVLVIVISTGSPNKMNGNIKDNKIPKNVSTNLHSPFKAIATITYNDMEIEGEFEKIDVGKATFVVTSPATLADVMFAYDDSVVTVSYKGFDFELPNNSKLLNTAIKYLIDVIDSASDPSSVSISSNEDGVVISGKYDKFGFDVLVDDNKVINGVKIPDLDLSIELKKVSY